MFWHTQSKINLHSHSSVRAASHSSEIKAARFGLMLVIGSGMNFDLFLRKEGGLIIFFFFFLPCSKIRKHLIRGSCLLNLQQRLLELKSKYNRLKIH